MNERDETAIQALSTAGAFCGECGFEPGDRGCPGCERTWTWYVDALRAAGWAPRDEALQSVSRLALAFENTGEPEIGRQIRQAIRAGAADQ